MELDNIEMMIAHHLAMLEICKGQKQRLLDDRKLITGESQPKPTRGGGLSPEQKAKSDAKRMKNFERSLKQPAPSA